jgi:predicted choloylglycine hydrolase
MWTGGGYFPPVKPITGVPTYILTSEILLKRTVAEAVAFLHRVPRAGAFMFLLGDATGAGAVIEATPRLLKVKYCNSVDYRANLFQFQETIADSAQVAATRKLHSTGRVSAIKRYIETHGTRFSLASVKRLLEHKVVRVHLPLKSTTLDALIAECERGKLLVKRGGARQDYDWIEYTV